MYLYASCRVFEQTNMLGHLSILDLFRLIRGIHYLCVTIRMYRSLVRGQTAVAMAIVHSLFAVYEPVTNCNANTSRASKQ